MVAKYVRFTDMTDKTRTWFEHVHSGRYDCVYDHDRDHSLGKNNTLLSREDALVEGLVRTDFDDAPDELLVLLAKTALLGVDDDV